MIECLLLIALVPFNHCVVADTSCVSGCSCVGGICPGSSSLIDRPEHRGAVGDEERSDSGPLDTP